MGTDEIKNEVLIDLYPNPSTTELTIKVPEVQNGRVRILSTEGFLVYEEMIESTLFTIDVSTLAKGMYYITFELDNEFISRNFIKSE